nr:MAG TPA: hypothetical protein [Caudoviricetes sp.]
MTFQRQWSHKPAGFEEQGPQPWACGKSPRSRYVRFGRRASWPGQVPGHALIRRSEWASP